MPSVRYYNQTAPFWDFVANMEEQGASHPWFANHGEGAYNENNEGSNPWAQGWGGFPFGSVQNRGRHGHHHHGPPPSQPPPEGGEQEGAAPPEYDEKNDEKMDEASPSEPRGPGHHAHGRHGWGGPRGRCGGRGRGGFGGKGRGGPFGPRGSFPFGSFGPLGEMFQSHLFGEEGTMEKSEEFTPEVDVFDTAESFVVHVSLPGAKKEDVGVNWDAERSELSIAGVVYRPGDEEFLKTLALNERKVGAFEKKVRLGSRANPAQVEVDAISARMEDGVLRIEVPKLDSGYVEIKKVDIE